MDKIVDKAFVSLWIRIMHISAIGGEQDYSQIYGTHHIENKPHKTLIHLSTWLKMMNFYIYYNSII